MIVFWLKRLPALLLLGLLSFSLPIFLLTLGSYAYFQNTGRILPGVRVEDIDLGWLSINEAEAVIQESWIDQNDVTIIILDQPDISWSAKASDFGLSIDAGATAGNAYLIGREGRGVGSILNLMTALRKGAILEPVVRLDAVQAKQELESWAQLVGEAPQEDTILIKGEEVVLVEARDGLSVDVLASLDLIIKDPATLLIDHQMLPLVVKRVPAQRYLTQEALQTVTSIRDADVGLNIHDPVTGEWITWSPPDSVVLGWVDIEQTSGKLIVTLAQDRMRGSLEAFNDGLGQDRYIDVQVALDALQKGIAAGELGKTLVEYRPRTYTVQHGDNLVSISFQIGMPYWKLLEVNPTLAQRGLVVGEQLIVPPRDDMLTLPIVPEKRIVISILSQRMWTYENGQMIGEHIISTGIPSSPTLPGIFQISSHELNAYASIWDLYMPHFMGIYDAVPGLTNGIHGLPLLSSGRRLWADVLGNPASYGCIILDLQAAEELFFWAEEGVVVEIRE
jgi:hypothetical protein